MPNFKFVPALNRDGCNSRIRQALGESGLPFKEEARQVFQGQEPCIEDGNGTIVARTLKGCINYAINYAKAQTSSRQLVGAAS